MVELGNHFLPRDRMRSGGPFVVSLRFIPLESIAYGGEVRSCATTSEEKALIAIMGMLWDRKREKRILWVVA